MKKIHFSSLILALLCASACEKDINLDFTAVHQETLFIEGMLQPGEIPKIYISRSNPYFGPKVSPQEVFVRGAVAKISEGSSVDSLVQDSLFNTARCRWEPFYRGHKAAEYGKTYRFELIFEGKTYTATTIINQQTPKIDTILYTPDFSDIYGRHDGVTIELTDHPGTQDFYRFQFDRLIDTSRHHANVLDVFVNTCVAKDEQFLVKDIGRIVFSDEVADGNKLIMPIEVSYEYRKDDFGWIFIQSLDKQSAEFYKDLDDQLQAIRNPFVEPVFVRTQIPGALGVFGSMVLSDSVKFVFPQDHP
jgi:Domain of unknown function (DUF4249)